MCNWLSRLKFYDLFTLDHNITGTRGHSWKLVKFLCTWDCRISIFFSDRVINRWNQLDQQALVLPAQGLKWLRNRGGMAFSPSLPPPPCPFPTLPSFFSFSALNPIPHPSSHSLLSLQFPIHPLPLPSPPLEIGPLNPARESGEHCKLPEGLGWSPSRN